MIDNITIRNIKETLDETFDLCQHNLVLGTWGSGKSTILDAIQVAILGKPMSDLYTGAGNAVVFDALCTGGQKQMSVAVESGAMIFTRSYARKNGTVTQELEIMSRGLRGVRECEAVIAAELGKSIFDLRVLRDDPETVKRILLSRFKLGEKWGKRGLMVAVLRSVTNACLRENWAEHWAEFAGHDLDALDDDGRNALIDAAMKALAKKSVPTDCFDKPYWAEQPGEDFFAFVARARDAVIDDRKAAARDAATEKKALAAFGNDMLGGDVPTVGIETLRKEIAALDADISKARASKGKAEASASRRAVIEKRIAEIEQVGDVRAVSDDELASAVRDREKMEKRYQELLAEKQQAAMLDKQAEDKAARMAALIDQIDRLDEEIAKAPESAATASPEMIARSAERVDVLRSLSADSDLCEACKRYIADRCKAAVALYRKLVPAAQGGGVDVAALKEQRAALQAKLEATREIEVRQHRPMNEIEAHVAEIEFNRKDSINQVTFLDIARKLEAEMQALNDELLTLSTDDADELTALLAGLEASVTEKRATLETLIAQKTKRETFAAHQAALAKAEKAVAVYEATEKAVKAYYSGMVAETFGPVIDRVTQGFHGIEECAGWEFYIELDDRGRLCFGVTKPVKTEPGVTIKTPYRALSGAESVFCRNVLGAVLLSMQEGTERVLMDEIAEVPVPLVPHVLAVMDSMTRDAGIQCIYATCHDVQAPDNWHVIRRGAGETEAAKQAA